jgi:hypothetical protein
LNFIFGIVCLFVCVCAFSLRRESPDMILGDKPLIFEVVLSQSTPAMPLREQKMIIVMIRPPIRRLMVTTAVEVTPTSLRPPR